MWVCIVQRKKLQHTHRAPRTASIYTQIARFDNSLRAALATRASEHPYGNNSHKKPRRLPTAHSRANARTHARARATAHDVCVCAQACRARVRTRLTERGCLHTHTPRDGNPRSRTNKPVSHTRAHSHSSYAIICVSARST